MKWCQNVVDWEKPSQLKSSGWRRVKKKHGDVKSQIERELKRGGGGGANEIEGKPGSKFMGGGCTRSLHSQKGVEVFRVSNYSSRCFIIPLHPPPPHTHPGLSSPQDWFSDERQGVEEGLNAIRASGWLSAWAAQAAASSFMVQLFCIIISLCSWLGRNNRIEIRSAKHRP